MNLEQIQHILEQVHGCTFASLNAQTHPAKGVTKIAKNVRVLLFSNLNIRSGYENMVKRRLAEIGADPAGFILGPLPFGERVKDTPIIAHEGKFYLQTILLHPGEEEFYLFDTKVNREDIPWLRSKGNLNQGLPSDKQVIVNTFSFESIQSIRLLGETLTA